MATRKEIRDDRRQTAKDVKQFHKTGKATPAAKAALRMKGLHAIWDISEGRGRKKWGEF